MPILLTVTERIRLIAKGFIPWLKSTENLYVFDTVVGPQLGNRAKVRDKSHIIVWPIPDARLVKLANGQTVGAIFSPGLPLKYNGAYYLLGNVQDPITGEIRLVVVKTVDDGFSWTESGTGPVLPDTSSGQGQNNLNWTMGIAMTATQIFVTFIYPQITTSAYSHMKLFQHDITSGSWGTYGNISDTVSVDVQDGFEVYNFLNLLTPNDPLGSFNPQTIYSDSDGSIAIGCINDFTSVGNIYPAGNPLSPYKQVGPYDGVYRWFPRATINDPWLSIHAFYVATFGASPPAGMLYRRWPAQAVGAIGITPYTQSDMAAVGWPYFLAATNEILIPYLDYSGNLNILRGDLTLASTNNANPSWNPPFSSQLIDTPPFYNGFDDGGWKQPQIRLSPDGTKIRMYLPVNNCLPFHVAQPDLVLRQTYVYVYYEQVIGSTAWSDPVSIGSWKTFYPGPLVPSSLAQYYPGNSRGPYSAAGDFADGTKRAAFTYPGLFGNWYWLWDRTPPGGGYIAGKGGWLLG